MSHFKALELSDQMLNQTTLHSSIKDIVTELLKEAILANMENSKGFLIDGYPQDIQQGEQFENEVSNPIMQKEELSSCFNVKCSFLLQGTLKKICLFEILNLFLSNVDKTESDR